jgi:hypothetical protein
MSIETRMVNFTCRKCGGTYKLDIGNASREEVIAKLKKWEGFECPGHHVELCSPLDFWKIDWSSLQTDKVPTEEEWLEEAKKKLGGKELLTMRQVTEKFTVLGFLEGMCSVSDKESHENHFLNYSTSPSGERYYWLAYSC